VQAYFDSGGNSLVREISAERDQASANLKFEEAATIHARVEKLGPIINQLPEIVQRLDRFSALMIQPSHVLGAVVFFRVEAGCISGPRLFMIQPAEQAKSQSMESRVQEALDTFPKSQARSLETMEHIAILKRWYFRGSRTGEIFFADARGELPMRRIVRGISRIFRGEKLEPEAIAPA